MDCWFQWPFQPPGEKSYTSHQSTAASHLAVTYLWGKNRGRLMRISKIFILSKVITKHTFQIKRSSCEDLDFDKILGCHQMMKKAALSASCLYHPNWPQLQVRSLCIFFLTPFPGHSSI